MRKTSVKLIKLTTHHTYTAFLWSVLCSHQFSSQGKMYVSQTPPCITTQMHRNAFRPFSTSNHGFIYCKLSLKCKVLVNHQAIPREENNYIIKFTSRCGRCAQSSVGLCFGRAGYSVHSVTNTSQFSCFGTELPCVSLLAPKGSHPSLKSKCLFTLPFEASVPDVLP